MEEEKLTKKEKRELAKEEKRLQREQEQTKSRTTKLLVVGVVVAIIGWFGYKSYQFINTPTQTTSVSVELGEDELIKGDRNAQVVLLEYGDFQCPACAGYSSIVHQLESDFGDNMAVVWRHFPLVSIHRNALPSAKAAEAANAQGKFWEMHDLLFDRQDDWVNEGNPKDKFLGYTKELGLDEEKFASDYESAEIDARVNDDLVSANALGLNATPSFFINGQKVVNPRGYEDLKSKIEAAMASE